jgi:hypothetical protein
LVLAKNFAMRSFKFVFVAGILLLTNLLSFAAENSTITELTNRLRIEIGGKLFTEYYFKDVPRPFCYPLIGPGEVPLTRNFPMQNVPGEDQDHPHHRSLWFTHGSVNGVDFWSESTNAGKIVHDKFLETKTSGKEVVIRSANNWIDAKGILVCTDERMLRIYNSKENSPRIIDFEITLHALKTNALTFGDTKEGSMAVRVAKSMQLLHGDGHIVMSTGVRDGETWGKRAAWCDYFGPVNGKTMGIAIFDHPKNPRHPTWWHVRDYGLFAANPFGVHDFEKKPKGEGDLVVPAGKKITFRYRLVLHEGDEKQSGLQKLYEDYSRK